MRFERTTCAERLVFLFLRHVPSIQRIRDARAESGGSRSRESHICALVASWAQKVHEVFSLTCRVRARQHHDPYCLSICTERKRESEWEIIWSFEIHSGARARRWRGRLQTAAHCSGTCKRERDGGRRKRSIPHLKRVAGRVDVASFSPSNSTST